MKKYIGAVVRKSFQLPIAAEQDHFENKSPVAKNYYLPGGLNKNKTIVAEKNYSFFLDTESRNPAQKASNFVKSHY